MKAQLLLFIIGLMGSMLHAESMFSQILISLDVNNVDIETLFVEIESQTGYVVLYKESNRLKRTVSINATHKNLEEILEETLTPHGLKYHVSGKQIVITEERAAPVAPPSPRQEKRLVTGIVTDANGEPLIGANVLEVGTGNGTITDIEGAYSLSVSSGAKLQFTYISYKTVEIGVGTKPVINVVLEEDASALDELIVVGYGVQRKSDITGALSRVTESQIKDRPVQNALQAMQGRAAGVDITTNTRPGEVGEVRIRGNRSITADNDPLYVIDGIPMVAGSISDINPNDIESMEVLKDASATAIYGSRGANGVVLVTTKKGKTGRVSINYDGSFVFTHINSLTDWMNAGQRIDWKRQAYINAGAYSGKYGTAPDPDVDGEFFGGIAQYPYMRPIFESAFQLNADGTPVMRAATEAEKAMGYADQVPVYHSSAIPTTHWMDLVTRTAFTHNHQVSLSAGTDISSVYMSIGYLDQESPMVDQDYKRYSFNLNGDVQATKWLRMGMGINASHSIQNYGMINNGGNTVKKDSYGYATSLEPYAPAYDQEGNILVEPAKDGPSEHNILLNINEATNETRTYAVMANSFAEATLLPWLKWRTNFGVQYRNARVGAYYGPDFTNPIGGGDSYARMATNSHNQRLSWALENLIYINKTLAGIHTLNVTLLQSAEYYREEGLFVRTSEVKFPTSLWYSVGDSNTANSTIRSSFQEKQIASYMARFNYSLLDKYLLTLTGRWDGASVLAKGNKWDFFPSMALAWKIDQEEFMERHRDWLTSLKFRIGYGVTGNAAIKPYQTGGSMASTHANQPFGIGDITTNTTGVKAEVLPNLQLGWEKTASTNVGVDFGFLDNRINGSVEYYVANTSDLLLNRSIPLMTGYTTILANIGKTRNQGWEITLSTTNIRTRDFSWRTDFTFSTNKEKIVELANGKEDDRGNGWFIGKPIDAIWTYKYDRLWQDTQEDQLMMAIYKANGLTFLPGQAKLVDQDLVLVSEGTADSKTVTLEDGRTVTYLDNGFGVFNNDDNHFQGSYQPKWVGGINTVFTYKNWELNSFIYTRLGNMYYGLLQTYGRRVEKDIWSETNPGGKYPQPRSGGTSYTNYSKYMNFTKGNMVIVRNIGLSYNFPESMLKKYKVGSLQLYGQVLNPFIWGGQLVKAGINPDDTTGWTTRSKVDDYTSIVGGQSENTAITRSYVLGVRIGF